MRVFVTGGAGFIGSNLTDRLVSRGDEVVIYDNFSTGREEFVQAALATRAARMIRGDMLDAPALTAAMQGCDFVFHLAANADVRFGTLHPRRDLEQNTIATFNLVEAMRANKIRRVAFASTGSVYGEATVIPTPEDAPFPLQTSLYAASKASAEAFIQAYCEGFDMQSYIFRFVSVLGERYTHGHVFDFVRSLRADPDRLRVLGNGKQRKSYLYVHDCIEAMLLVTEKATEKINVFNVGADEYSAVTDSVRWITEHLGVSPRIEYTGGERGWIGDSPFIFLDTRRIQALGWRPTVSIHDAIVRTVEYLTNNPHLFDAR